MTANAPGQKPESAADLIELLEVREAPLPDGDTGEGLRFRTNRGEFNGIIHRAPDAKQAVIWVCGARGGFGGPGPGTYAKLAEELTGKGITSVRLDYRFPSDLLECVLDLLAGVSYCKSEGCDSIVVVGHSFGGAVVIAGGRFQPGRQGSRFPFASDPRRRDGRPPGPSPALGGPRQGRHPPPLLLCPTDIRMGERAQGTRTLRRGGTPAGRM